MCLLLVNILNIYYFILKILIAALKLRFLAVTNDEAKSEALNANETITAVNTATIRQQVQILFK